MKKRVTPTRSLRDNEQTIPRKRLARLKPSPTRTQRAAQELSRFFANSLGMLCIAGFDGYFKRLNPAWKNTLGWTLEELHGSRFLEFVHPDDRAATLAEVKQLARI
jgi:PAS domain-containing protein